MDKIEYNFIVPKDSSVDLDGFREGSHADFISFYGKGEFCWSLQTYQLLKVIGLPVSLSQELLPDTINLAHGNTLRALPKSGKCFYVSLQADFPHYPLAQFNVVQNKDQVTENSCFVPHWPQPGLIPRNSARKGVSVVAYQGLIDFTDLDPVQLNADLKPHGMRFEILGSDRWGDLSEVDVLVGIRSFGTKEYKRKPPSKLINAWHAGIPFIGGWDCAFSQVGTPGEDYLRVRTYDQLLVTLLELKENPTLYSRLKEAGLQRAQEFTPEAISNHWKTLLETEVEPRYVAWEKAPPSCLAYGVRVAGYKTRERVKSVLRQLAQFPPLKRLRTLYYDPCR